jgi:hypothetical protein
VLAVGSFLSAGSLLSAVSIWSVMSWHAKRAILRPSR